MAIAPPVAPSDPSPSADPFNTVAEMLVNVYLDTAAMSSGFKQRYAEPPSQMTKAHYIRSIVQALLLADDGFELDGRYREMGRVEFLHRGLTRRFLLRSNAALKWEAKLHANTLFDVNEYVDSDVMILVSEFGPNALTLSQVGARQKAHTTSLVAKGTPSQIGVWQYVPEGPTTFDQGGSVDAFGELGDIDLDGNSAVG